MTDSDNHSLVQTVGRRTFLKVLGSSAPAAAVAACGPASPERIISYTVPPEDEIPGIASWYATVCGECPAGCGMRVRTREGRAVKVEGNPDHPVNRGGLCIRGQASLQGLYNPDRFGGPQRRRVTDPAGGHGVLEPIGWSDAEADVVERLRRARERGPGRIAIVTPRLTGTLDMLVEQWAEAIGARRIRYEPFAYEAMREANARTFGRPVVARYDLSAPSLIISFGADVLETWLSTVGYSRDFSEGRRSSGNGRTQLVQLEPRCSLTGAAADERIEIEPGTEGLLAAAMVHTVIAENRVVVTLGDGVGEQIQRLVQSHSPDDVAGRTGVPADAIRGLARRFADPAQGPGHSVAVGGGVAATGEMATETMVAINILNLVAGNVGSTVVFDETDPDADPAADWSGVGSHRDMQELAASLQRGDVDLLLLHDINPVYALPGGDAFADAMAGATVVSTSSCPDETSSRADLVLPTHTPLEAWGDAVPRPGVHGLMQPSMRPVFDTKHLGDVLLDLGRQVGTDVAAQLPSGDFVEVLQGRWRRLGAADRTDQEFEVFWAEAQQRGGFWEPAVPADVQLSETALDRALQLEPDAASPRALSLIVFPSLHFYDGRGANRPWLQEVPDPLTKAAWSSWAELAPETAASIGAEDGQLVTVESDHGTVDVTVLVNPAVRSGVVAIPLGQGHRDYGRFATGRGVNPTALLDPASGAGGGPRWLGTRVDVTARDVRRPVPRTQTTFTQEGRGIAQSVSAAALLRPSEDDGPAGPPPSLYPDHEHPEHRWGMAIDLDACTGCNACVAACYAENNVPVLGADGMRGGRSMSWLRIERFVEHEASADDHRFVPMLCQQCDHAPCETVCPTYATYHTDEGLNAQVYNRCVGTRYCANNCPYKVRRFNWFNPEVPEPLHLQLNPDVTTRVAGVMEKCTFCVQRIQEGKNQAWSESRDVRDGEITPACAQTCPAQAIVFGDLNDPESRVSRLADDRRAYRVLESLGTRPAVTYLKKIRTAT